jgi:hypothetical protein
VPRKLILKGKKAHIKLSLIEIIMTSLFSQIEDQLDHNSECRICFSDSPSTLISPCNCKGSLKFVHQDCLLRWLQSKFHQRLRLALLRSYNEVSGLSCELCKIELNLKTSWLPLTSVLSKLSCLPQTYYFLLNCPIVLYLAFFSVSTARKLLLHSRSQGKRLKMLACLLRVLGSSMSLLLLVTNSMKYYFQIKALCRRLTVSSD